MSRKLRTSVRALQRITLVLAVTSVLFLTLAVAGLSAIAQVGGACPEPCGVLSPSEGRRPARPIVIGLRRIEGLPVALATVDLSVVKIDANPNVRPGGTLTYRIFYENSGTASATDVVITDTLPAHTTHLYNDAGSEGWTTTVSGTTVIWHRDIVSPSVSGNFDVVLKVDDDVPADAPPLVNRVEIATATDESNIDNNTWETQPTVVRVADVHVIKTGPAEVGSGDRITYTIQCGNQGSEPADSVIITDTLPAGISYLASGGDIGSPPVVNGQRVVWSVGNLQPATTASITLVGQIDADQPSYTTLTNTVTVSTQTPERDRANNVATSTARVRPGPPASVQLSAPASIQVQTSATFTAGVLDAWANPVADDTLVSFAGNALIATDPSALTVGGVATATLTAETQVGSAIITATAGSVVGTASLEVVPGPVGELRLAASEGTQTVGEPVRLRTEVFDSHGNPVDAGIPVSFTTTLGEIQPPISSTDPAGTVTTTLVSTRTGTAIVSAHSVGFQDSAVVLFTPGPTEQITVTANPPAVPVDGAKSQILATLTDRYGNRVGDSVTVTFNSSLGAVAPMTATTVAGRATTILTSGPVHGQSSVTVTVGAYTGTTEVEFLPADLRIEATHSPNTDILPGTAVTYTITYENAGGAMARDVVITNTLPVGFIDTGFQSSGATITTREGTTYVWDVEDLSPGEGGTIVLWGRFDRNRQWPPSQLVANVAAIGSATAEGNQADNTTSSGNLILTANVYVQVAIDDGGTDLQPGGKIKYQLHLGNYGPALAQTLAITSTLPPHTSLWDWRETGHEPRGLMNVSDPEASVQVWRYDDTVDGPNFGEFYIWLNIDPSAPGGVVLGHDIEISTETPESNYTDNTQLIERRLSGVNLEVSLRGPATIIPDRMITYTLLYTNTGTLPADNVTLSDVVPPGVSVIDVSRTPTRIEPELIEWELGSVADGQWEQIAIVGRVGADVNAGQTLRNALGITTTSAESYTGDNTAEVNTQVVPDAPASLALEMDATTVAAGTVTPLTVNVADQFGNSIDGLTVTLTTTVGVVTPTLATTVQGAARAMFVAPTFPSQGNITATLVLGATTLRRSSGQGSAQDASEGVESLSDTLEVVVVPGPPSNLRLEAAIGELPADGRSTTVIRAYVGDAYGNPVVDGTPVTFDTNRGTLYNDQLRHTVGTLDGRASTVLRSDRFPGSALVIASAGATSAQIAVEFLPVPKYTIYLPLIRD